MTASPPNIAATVSSDRHQIQLEESSPLLLFVGDVEGSDQSAHAARRTPQCQQHPGCSAQAQRPARCADQLVNLIGQHLLRLLREHTRQRGDLLFHLRWIEHQAIDRYQCGQAREQGQQDGISDAAGDEEKIGVGNLLPHSPKDIAPPTRRDLPGVFRLASAIVILVEVLRLSRGGRRLEVAFQALDPSCHVHCDLVLQLSAGVADLAFELLGISRFGSPSSARPS